MPSKLQELKQEIQRLKPEIMELKFGCELSGFSKALGRTFFLEDGGNIEREWVSFYPENGVKGGYVDRPIYSVSAQHPATIEYQVLGRPITLEDALFCCIEAYSKFGIITKKSYEEMLGGVVGLWDFTKDFDNQSEEFYDEIMFLLQ